MVSPAIDMLSVFLTHRYRTLLDLVISQRGAGPHPNPRAPRRTGRCRHGCGSTRRPEGVEVLAGNRVPKRGEPLAMAYAGHQFGTFVPQLGDGRAILLGEVIDRDGMRRDIQLKGSS
jgi:hypothetical protein